MKRFLTPLRLALALATMAATVAAVGGQAAAAGHTATYTVTITNLDDGQYLTPPNWAAHSRAADVFQVGRPASAGVQAVAENGGVPTLAGELAVAIDGNGLGVSGVAGPAVPIGPGQSRTWEVTTDEQWLTVVAMIVCTNDGFAGLDTKRLPSVPGQTKTYNLQSYDAGTELNTELRQDIVPAPFCGDGPGSGVSNPALAEGGVVMPHPTLTGAGDLADALDWAGPIASIEITRN